MAGQVGGGNYKKVGNTSEPPWASWKGYSRPAHAIKFMETYCRTPTGHRPRELIQLSKAQKEFFEEILSGDYNQAIKSCPRGEGKSTEMAALGNWAVFAETESGDPQVPIIATTVGQAKRSIYDVATKMIELEPELSSRAKIYTGIGVERVAVPWSGGEMFPMSNKVDSLQGLNPTVAIMDEIGFQAPDSWASLVLALGKRPWSIAIGTGTPGFDYDNALWEQRKIFLENEREVEGLYYLELAADADCEITDEQILKANPSIVAGYKSLKDLKRKLTSMPESRFRIFHLGQWVEGVESWLGDSGLAIWRGLVDPYEFVDGADTWVGVDIGLKQDSTAVVWGQRRPDGRLHVKCKIWMPSKDRVIDVAAIMEFLRDLHRKYKVQSFAYDPRLFQLPAQYLTNEKLPMVEMNQSLERMAPAFSELLRVIKTAGLSHDGDGDFEKQILAGRPKNTERGFTLYKMKYTMKIDACYALAMMFDRAQHIVKPKPKLVVDFV